MTQGDFRQGIYLTHRSALIDYATPILGTREAAEDIVQDAFLKFIPAQPKAGPTEQTIGYLYRIVRNLALDVLRHRAVEARQQKNGFPFWTGPQEQLTPEQEELLRDDARCVVSVLAELPANVRIALEMYRFGGFTLEEVAEHLGVSVATAHRYVKAAMLRIAERLGP